MSPTREKGGRQESGAEEEEERQKQGDQWQGEKKQKPGNPGIVEERRARGTQDSLSLEGIFDYGKSRKFWRLPSCLKLCNLRAGASDKVCIRLQDLSRTQALIPTNSIHKLNKLCTFYCGSATQRFYISFCFSHLLWHCSYTTAKHTYAIHLLRQCRCHSCLFLHVIMRMGTAIVADLTKELFF